MLQSPQSETLALFESELLNELRNNSKNSVNTIENNQKIIREFYEKDSTFTKNFVQKLNNTLLSTKIEDYSLVDKVLGHPSFTKVLSQFRESDILIRACDENNKDLVKWLLTKDINLGLQDQNGRTALMYAAQHYTLIFAVESMIKTKGKFIELTDNNGNTALFYAALNVNVFEKMVKAPFDFHHVNNDNENILLYNCKYDAYKAFSKVLKLNLDPNLVNSAGKTAAMYLVEHGRNFQLRDLVKKYHIDVNYQNKFGDSLVSVLIKKYYSCYTDVTDDFFTESNYLMFKNFASTLTELVELGCNFNVTIDEDGNTPLIYFLLTEEYVCANYILSKCRIDLSPKNKYGTSASLLSLYLNDNLFENLDYQKKRNEKKISMKSLKKLLMVDGDTQVYDKLEVENVKNNRYRPNVRTSLVQQWFMEVLYPNAGAVIKRRTQLTNANNGSYIFVSGSF